MSCLLLNLSRLLCMFFSYVATLIIWWVRLALTCRNEQVFFSCWVLRSRGWIRTRQHELNVPFDQRGLGPALSWPPLWRGSHMPSPSITRGCTVAFAGGVSRQILCPSWTPWRCWVAPLQRRWVADVQLKAAQTETHTTWFRSEGALQGWIPETQVSAVSSAHSPFFFQKNHLLVEESLRLIPA